MVWNGLSMYKFERELDLGIDKAFLKTTQLLKEKGYVVLSYVDVSEMLNKNFGDDFPGYYILNVCKPEAARKMIPSNHDYGLFLPCKIVIEVSGERSILKMLLVSELASEYLKVDPSVPAGYEKELIEVLNSL